MTALPLRIHLAGMAAGLGTGRELPPNLVKQQRAMPVYLTGIAGGQTMFTGPAVVPSAPYTVDSMEPLPVYVAGSALSDGLPANVGALQKARTWPWYIVGTVGPVPTTTTPFGSVPADLGSSELATPVYIAGCAASVAAGYALSANNIARGASDARIRVRGYRSAVLRVYISGSNGILLTSASGAQVLATEAGEILTTEGGKYIRV